MKVYVVSLNFEFEGYEEPSAVFSSLSLAEAYVRSKSNSLETSLAAYRIHDFFIDEVR